MQSHTHENIQEPTIKIMPQNHIVLHLTTQQLIEQEGKEPVTKDHLFSFSMPVGAPMKDAYWAAITAARYIMQVIEKIEKENSVPKDIKPESAT